MSLILIGYWSTGKDSEYPHPRYFIDIWPGDDKDKVVKYLKGGVPVNRQRGMSNCRFCGVTNGTHEKTDGKYIWPSGYDHYIEHHSVTLPLQFLAHIRSNNYSFFAKDINDLQKIDYSFWNEYTKGYVERTNKEWDSIEQPKPSNRVKMSVEETDKFILDHLPDELEKKD